MPGVKRTKSAAKRKRGKRVKTAPTKVKIVSGIVGSYRKGPLPLRTKSVLIYSDKFSMNGGAGGLAYTYNWSANGVYDPDISGTGHQPRGFDELISLYDHCVVIYCKAHLLAFNTDTSNAQIIGMGVYDQPMTSATATDYTESRMVTMKPLARAGSGPAVTSLEISVDPNKFLGRSKPLSDPELKNSNAANPGEQAYITVFAMAPANLDPSTINCQIRLEYTAVFIEPKQPGQS